MGSVLERPQLLRSSEVVERHPLPRSEDAFEEFQQTQNADIHREVSGQDSFSTSTILNPAFSSAFFAASTLSESP